MQNYEKQLVNQYNNQSLYIHLNNIISKSEAKLQYGKTALTFPAPNCSSWGDDNYLTKTIESFCIF